MVPTVKELRNFSDQLSLRFRFNRLFSFSGKFPILFAELKFYVGSLELSSLDLDGEL